LWWQIKFHAHTGQIVDCILMAPSIGERQKILKWMQLAAPRMASALNFFMNMTFVRNCHSEVTASSRIFKGLRVHRNLSWITQHSDTQA
jgi:hypothetical protein